MPYIGSRPPPSALTSSDIADSIITEAKMADDAISLTELKAGTDGEVISWDASGNPVAIAAGTSGHFLKSQGAGSQPVFAAAGGAWSLISSQTASDSASIEFDGSLTDTYRVYKLFGDNVVGANDGVYLNFTFKRDGEGSYNTGASDYQWIAERFRNGQSLGTRVEDTSDAVMRGRCDFGNSTGELVNFETTIYPRTGKYPTICTRETGMDATDALGQYMSVGRLSTAADVQSIKVACSSGNIATGNFALYGLKIS